MAYKVTYQDPNKGETELAHEKPSGLIAEAVRADHPCTDTIGCDIASMQDGGWPRGAAGRLLSATDETPALLAVTDKYPSFLTARTVKREQTEWWEYVKPFTVICPECGTHLYGDPSVRLEGDPEPDDLPGHCTNCTREFDPATAERPGQ